MTQHNRELAHDVQVRVQAERAVRDSERLLKQFVEAMPVGVFVAHVDGTPYFANELAVELFGPEILQTKSLEDLAGVFRGFQSGTDQIYHASRTPVMRALQGEKSSIADMVVERNNRRIPLQAWGSPVLDSSGNVRLAVTAFVDISERLAIEERARQTQQDLAHLSRLNTMGEMASGLAHELNQPLMAIVAYIRSCILNLNGGQWKLEKDRDTLCKVLEDAAAESLRAGEIIRRLRRLVKKHAAERLPTDLNDAIREICSMVETEAHVQKIQLKLDLQPDLPEVPVDRVQTQQVVLNLVRNAFDAILQTNSDVRIVQVSTRIDDDAVQVTVSDTGPRIPDEDVAKFFEPFFTQKERGLGMGLPISRSIIESHQGTLTIHAQPSGGLCASFRLPLRPDEANPWAMGGLPNQANP